ncbi:MAG: PQQ-binding-like beta-propeller repeat protein [Chloroflexi bacterium]|nr:PQQ-binding-like beta-propeller repeat protein [Chloroflexota bacterium]
MDTASHPWFDPNTLVGETLQGYSLEALLGTGGFGAVYRTRNPQGEPRAIKVLYPPRSLATDDVRVWDTRLTHFQREVLNARGFTHPNIIRVYDSGQGRRHFTVAGSGLLPADDRSGQYPLAYYVAELIPDGVDRHLREGRLFSPQEAVRIALQVCDALIALHSAKPQIVHRDLNPGNIRLADGGRVVLTDFGVARIEGVPGTYVTSEGPLIHRGVGAPEQFRSDELDQRTDIYQCGALLLVMLTGKYPHEGEPRVLLAQKAVPNSLSQAILRCLEHERANRFPDAAALKVALSSSPPPTPSARWAVSAWQRQVETPYWPTLTTPLVEGNGCYLWDSQTVYRLNPETGTTIWAWRASGLIREGFQGAAVQLSGEGLYVRHGTLLSCLDPRGIERWRARVRSATAGAFVAAGDAVIVDSYAHSGGAPLGLSALAASTGGLIWDLPLDEYHVLHLAAAQSALVLVESMGLAASGGMRVRTLDVSSGEVRGVFALAEHLRELEAHLGPAPLLRALQPVVMQEGAIVVGITPLSYPRPYLACLDAGLKVRWTHYLDLAPASSNGEVSLAGSQDHLVASVVTRDAEGRTTAGWLAGLDLQSGERVWQREGTPGAVLSRLTSGGQEPLVFGIVQEPGRSGRGRGHWRLATLDPATGQELWRGQERDAPGGSLPLGPVVTPTRVYVQVPTRPPAPRRRGAVETGPGAIETFQRR